jgi:hypothetical protein
MSLLTIVQDFCERKSLPSPTSVLGSADPQIKQIRALIQKGCEDLFQRGRWESLINEASWTTTATESQGTIVSRATNGFMWMLPETFWDRTQKLPLLGPLDSADWQVLKAIVVTGPRYSFRFMGGIIKSTPAPPAGHTWVFEYISKNWILQADGVTYLSKFAADTDNVLFPEQVVTADLEWRWLKEKGLNYQEDFNAAERLIVNALGRSGSKPVLHLDDFGGEIKPGIFVPSGSWMTP